MALCPKCFRTAEANYCRLCGVALIKDELEIARLQRSKRTQRIKYYFVVGVLTLCVAVVATLLWRARVDRRISVEILDREVAELPKRVSLSVMSHLISGGQRVDCSGVADCRRKIPETARVLVAPEVDFSVEFNKSNDQLYTVRVSHSRGKGRRCLLKPGEKLWHACEPPLSDKERRHDDEPARSAYNKTEGDDAIPTLDQLDSRYGIRGLPFGTDIRDIDAVMFFVEGCDFDDGDVKCYTRDVDGMTQWGTELQTVGYYFFRHRLMSVCAVIKHGTERTLLSKIQSVYGPGTPGSKTGGYFWEGKRVRISYEDNPAGGRVWVASREIRSQQMAAHPQS
jgi:hypothetical protein